MFRQVGYGCLAVAALLSSGCIHGMAYTDYAGLGPDAPPMPGTGASLTLLGHASRGVLTGSMDGETATNPIADRAACLLLGGLFLTDLPGTFAMDVVTAPNQTARWVRSTWNDD